jgi:hypothetical protein
VSGSHAWTPLLAAAQRTPNLEAQALSPTLGWWVLLAVFAFVALCIVHAETWRRLWMRAEDPRTIGLFRILFSVLLLLNLVGLWEHLEFLFTDEGLFYTDTARKVLAAKQFAHYREDAGLDFATALSLLTGPRHSLLLLRSDPTFFWIHLWVYVAAVVAMMVGWRTRTATVLVWFLMNSLSGRNPIYLTGADDVFKVFGFLMMLTRSGHAYSVDNWLRCRRLRREGRLSERGRAGGGAGLVPDAEHPHGLEAIYRRIPAWPRMLMMLQLATVYLYTGSAKTGGIWSAGDSLYYALNLDHFYRAPPQFMSSLFGTNVFRLMTWGVHFWQIGFPLMLVGLVARFALREGLVPVTGWRRPVSRLLWITIGVAVLGVVIVALPVHVAGGGPSVATIQWMVGVGGALGMLVIGWGWRRLRDRPFVLRARGRTVAIDLDGFTTWVLGRRLWLTIGVFFHVQIFMLMNIGMFAPVMILVYLVCLNGTETASLLRALGRVAARLRVPGMAALVRPGEAAIPPEDPSLPRLHRDRGRMPTWALVAAMLAVLGVVLTKVFATGQASLVVVASAGALALVVGGVLGRRVGPALPAAAAPWAYGPLGRGFATAFVIVHITAVALHCIPNKDSCHAFRPAATSSVAPWMNLTQTGQAWEMFAPNPMRTNDFLEVLVTDADGEVWDLRTDANSPRNKPTPWIWYDRAGKITRRVNGEGKWYRPWLGRYHCRQWALEHDGVLPKSVELVKVWYDIPKPEVVAARGYYRPAELLERAGHRTSMLTVRCAREEDAQPTNAVRARHGLAPVAEGTIVRRVPKVKDEPAEVDAVGG